jgi:ribosomal protein S6
MSKPKTKEEAHLRRKFKAEEELPHELERDVRVDKRIWKRATSKLQRRFAKQDIEKGLEDNDET